MFKTEAENPKSFEKLWMSPNRACTKKYCWQVRQKSTHHELQIAATRTAPFSKKSSAPVPNMLKTKMLWWKEHCLSILLASLKQRVWSQTAYHQLCMSLGELIRTSWHFYLLSTTSNATWNQPPTFGAHSHRPSRCRRHLCKNVGKLCSVDLAGTSQTNWMSNLK